MLRTDEAVPTPDGWSTIGDLQPGDHIFTETGATCTVTAVHPIDLQPASYKLTFDDGTAIEACADHLWLTFDERELAALTRRDPQWRAQRRARRPSRATGRRSERFTSALTERNSLNPPPALEPPTGTVRTTKQIAGTLLTPRGRTNHAIPVAGALQLPDADLPIDPYVLGAWLGDGHSDSAAFTCADPEIIDEIRAAGVAVSDRRKPAAPYAWGLGDTTMRPRANGRPGWVNSFAAGLRGLGILGAKRVPDRYLRASREQRLALLQGLMDTDGTVNKAGQPSFVTTNPEIAEGFHELVVSLGWRVRSVERRAKLNGRDCGPMWTFKWSPDAIVFRLPRKVERQVLAARRTTRFRYIIGCEETAPSPMRCITVDNPTGLFLVGRSMLPTHNTVALVMEGVRAAVRHPGMRVLLLRRSYDELAESIYPEFERIGWASAVGGAWNKTDKQITFTNGSVIRLRYMENLTDASRRQGGGYQLLLVDERTLMPPGVIDTISFERLRSAHGVPVLGIRSSSNPGGPSHAEVKTRYVEETNWGREVVTEKGISRRFIPAKATDNPHLDAAYHLRLDAIPDEKRRAAMRDGDWDQFAGMMFPEWRRDRHVLEPIGLPDTLVRYNGIDWGFTAPWCVLWAAVDEDGRVWIYREIYRSQVGESEQAAQILAAEADESVAARYADDAMWATRGEAKPVATVYAENGVPLTPAGKGGRVTGWQRVHSYLREAPACAHHRALGWTSCPLLHVFSTCSELIRTLPALPHAQTGDPEDADTKAEDHAPDALRYALINIGGGAQFLTLPAPVDTSSQIAPLPTLGRFAYRPHDGDPSPDWGTEDTDSPARGATQPSPFA